MNQAPNFLYAAVDKFAPSRGYQKTTIVNSTTLGPEGATLQLASAAQFGTHSGEHAYTYITGGGLAVVGRITRLVSADQVFFLPIFEPTFMPLDIPGNYPTTAPYVPVNITAGASTIQWLDLLPCELQVDLSRVAESSCKYLVLTQASVIQSVSPSALELSVFSGAIPGRPYSYQSRVGLGRRTSGSPPSVHNFFQAHSIDIAGGDCRAFHFSSRFLLDGPQAVGASQLAEHARICALRVDPLGSNFVVAGHTSGGLADGIKSTSAAVQVTSMQLTAPVAGTYNVVVSGMLGTNGVGTATAALVLFPAAGGATTLFSSPMQSAAGERYSIGYVTRLTLAANDILSVVLTPSGGATASLDSGYMCAFLDPDYIEEVGSQASSLIGFNPATTDFQQMASRQVTLAAQGRTLEFISFVPTGATNFQVRPRFGGDQLSGGAGVGNGVYAANYRARGALDAQYATTTNGPATVFFHRGVRPDGIAANQLDVARLTPSAANGSFGYVHFLWFRLRDSAVRKDQPSVHTAKVESALFFKKSWQPTEHTGVHENSVTPGSAVSRVVWNGANMVRSTSNNPPSGSYYYNETTGKVRVRVTGAGGDANDTPNDPDHFVLICVWMTAATRQVALNEADGSARPYIDRLQKLPSIDLSSEFRPTGGSETTSIGDLELAAADREFDPQVRLRRWDGLRYELRGGPLSERWERNHTLIASGLLGGNKLTEKTLALRTYSVLAGLSTLPVTEAKMAVQQGTTGVPVNILAPRIIGFVPRIPFYRTTNDLTAPGSNTYKASDFPVAGIGKIYRDGAIAAVAIAEGAGGVTARSVTAATCTVANAAFDDPTTPPDSVYGDVWGHGIFSPALAVGGTNRLARYPGERIRCVLAMVGFPLDNVLLASLSDLDVYGRRRLVGTARVPAPPLGGTYIDTNVSVAEVVNNILRDIAALRVESLIGRLGVGVPDFRYQQLATNPGFDRDVNTVWPWGFWNSASGVITQATVFGDGPGALDLSNGGGDAAMAAQRVVIRRPGQIVALTPLVAGRSGETNMVRLGIVRPGDGIRVALSEPFSVTSNAWRRLLTYLPLDEDEAGSCLICIFPAYGSTLSTSIVVDDFDAWPVALLSKESDPTLLDEIDEETYYSARVVLTRNFQAGGNQGTILTDADLKGITRSLVKYAAPGSGQIDPGPVLLVDLPSTAGVAGALLEYYGLPRHKIARVEELPIGMPPPQPGEILLDDTPGRKIESPDGLPVYSIRAVTLAPNRSGASVAIRAEAPTRPQSDPMAISSATLPLGMILPSSDGTCPGPDWIKYSAAPSEARDLFITGTNGVVVNPGNVVGTWTHIHAAAHVHALTPHTHTVAGITIGASDIDANYQSFIGPLATVSRGPAEGDHTHPPKTGPFTSTSSGAVNSAQPSSLVDLVPGSNLPTSVVNVVLCKRTGSATSGVPTNLVWGYELASLPGGYNAGPAGWNGKVLRVASELSGASTTLSSPINAPTAGTPVVCTVSSGAQIKKHRTCVVSNGSASFTAVVTDISGGTTLTLLPLGLVGDNNAANYPASTSTLTVVSTAAGTTATYAQHQHGGVIPAHAHDVTHEHAAGGTPITIDAAPETVSSTALLASGAQLRLAMPDHTHNLLIRILSTALTSGTATPGGTVDAASGPNAPTLGLAMIVSANATTTQLATALIGWTDAGACPPGWTEYPHLTGRILMANSGGFTLTTDGHSHPLAFAAHTVTHNHGGSQALGPYDGGDPEGAIGGIYRAEGVEVGAAYGPHGPGTMGHPHELLLTGISSQSATLQATTGTSSFASGAAVLPPAYALRTCRRD